MTKLQKKYKIALVAYRLGGGGSERVMANLSKYFDACGIDVHIVTVIDEVGYDFKGTVFSTQQYKSNEGWFGRFTRLKALFVYFRKNKFDYIIDFRFRTKRFQELLIARWVYNAPVILTIHSSAIDHYIPINRRWADAIYKKAFSIITITEFIHRKLQKEYNFNNLRLIYNPVDFEKVFHYMEQPIDIRNPFILIVAQMENRIKQIDHLIKAYSASCKKWPVVICGEGVLMDEYKELAQQLGCDNKVYFTGFQSNPYAYMRQAKFLVLCSAFEGLPNVLIECLACETPVVSYDCISGPDEIIQHEYNGLLVENQNITALTQSMDRMMTEEKLLAYCKKNAKISVQKFDLQAIGKQWIELMNMS